jgi:hypothetical protein
VRIRHRPLEIASLTAAGVAAFAFTAGQATAAETSSVVLRIAAKMIAISTSERRPFLFTFGRSGAFTRIRLRR